LAPTPKFRSKAWTPTELDHLLAGHAVAGIPKRELVRRGLTGFDLALERLPFDVPDDLVTTLWQCGIVSHCALDSFERVHGELAIGLERRAVGRQALEQEGCLTQLDRHGGASKYIRIHGSSK
jgi:hypothetical protein